MIMLYTRKQCVIDLCTFPALELYICMHIICDLHYILSYSTLSQI